MTYVCKYCGKEFNTKGGCSRHERYCLKNPQHDTKAGHESWNKGKTANDDPRIAKSRDLRKQRIASGEIKCCGHAHTEETKKLLSIKRKQYLAEHPDEYVWKRHSKFKSAPCEHLKNLLKAKEIFFVEEYLPFDDCAITLDIAFPDVKIAIEVNGNQHYNRDGSLADYYQARHNKLELAGWTVYELHYTQCYNIESLEDLLKLDIYNKDYVGKYFSSKEQRQLIKQQLADEQLARKQQKLIEIENKKQLIISSNIDFTKFGWVKHVAKLLNINSQKVCHWMQKYLPEFYKNCYHRNAPLA